MVEIPITRPRLKSTPAASTSSGAKPKVRIWTRLLTFILRAYPVVLTIVKVITVLVGSIVVLVILFVAVKEILKPQVKLINSISVPKELEAIGYTPEMVANRILDGVTQIVKTAAKTKRAGIYSLAGGGSHLYAYTEDAAYMEDASTKKDIYKKHNALDTKDNANNVDVYPADDPYEDDFYSPDRPAVDDPLSIFDKSPDFDTSSNNFMQEYDISIKGVSFKALIYLFREVFRKNDDRLSGDIAVGHPYAVNDGKSTPKTFSIHLRLDHKATGIVHNQTVTADKLDMLFEQAAFKIVERFYPLEAAYYSYYKRDDEDRLNALRIVEARLLKSRLINLLDDKEALKLSPEDKEALNLLGMIRHAEHRSDDNAESCCSDARKILEKLNDSAPDFAPGRYNLSYVLVDQGIREKDSEKAKKLFDQAVDVAQKGIDLDKRSPRWKQQLAIGYATKGRALSYLGKWDEANVLKALDNFDQSERADPGFIYPYVGISTICLRLRSCEPQSKLIADIDPVALGGLFYRFRKWDEAAYFYKRAAELEPSAFLYAYWGSAVLHSQRDDKIEEARKLFELSIKTDPSIPNGHNQLGLLYLWDLKKFDKAADEFRKAIEIAPQWSNYHVNLAEALRHAGKHEDAIAAAYKAIQIYPHNKRAACLLREKDHKDLTKCRPAESRTK